MMNAIKMELFKFRHLKSFKILLIVELSFAVLGLVSMFFIQRTEFFIESGLEVSGAYIFTTFTSDTNPLLFAAIFSGLFIGSEFTHRTINQSVSSGISRFSILFSKTLVYLLSTTIFIVIYIIFGTVTGTIMYGWGSEFTADTLGYILRTVGLELLLFYTMSMFFLLFAFLSKSTALSIVMSFLFIFLPVTIFALLSHVNDAFLWIYNNTPMYLFSKINAEVMTTHDLVASIVLPVVLIPILFFASYMSFKKSELK